jgi:hypothetical protein
MLALVAAGLWAARLDAPSAALSTGRSAADCTPPHIGLGTGEDLNDPTQFPGAVGELRMGMLFVDFADMRGESDPRALYDAFVPRAVEWYRTVSYDRPRLA